MRDFFEHQPSKEVNPPCKEGTLPETNSSPLKMDGWNTTFLLGRPFLGTDRLICLKKSTKIFTKNLQEILILDNIPNTQNLIQITIPKSVSSKHQLQITFWKQNEERSFLVVKQQIHTFHWAKEKTDRPVIARHLMELPWKVQINRWKIVKLSFFFHCLASFLKKKRLLIMPPVNVMYDWHFEFVVGDPETMCDA